jgi:hypothetical protein
MSRSGGLVLATATAIAIGEAASLVARGTRGQSDFGVFYRTCELLADGIGLTLYLRRDAVALWLISLAPAGQAIFQPLCSLSPAGASAVWALVNIALLAASIVGLHRLLKQIDASHAAVLTPWAAAVLVVLAAGSIQVGQFSVLFVACWVLSMTTFAAGHTFSAGLFLAFPTAAKLYPGLMLAVPLSLATTTQAVRRVIVSFGIGLLIFSLLIPSIAYGGRAWTLNVSFWDNVILSSTGRLPDMQRVRTGSNQSLDTVLLRYLSYDFEFHELFPDFPHVEFATEAVLMLANAVRLLIGAMTVAAVVRWRRRKTAFDAHDVLTVTALWSATLYLMLPETKARYAAYTFVAFVPLVEAAVAAVGRARLVTLLEIVTCLFLIVGPEPELAKTYGVGLIGPLILWLANLRLMYKAEDRPPLIAESVRTARLPSHATGSPNA